MTPNGRSKAHVLDYLKLPQQYIFTLNPLCILQGEPDLPGQPIHAPDLLEEVLP